MFDIYWLNKYFWPKVNVVDKDKCWIWEGHTYKDGYGQCSYKNKKFRTHRVSYMLHNKFINKEILVCHHCDNPKCVNPSHLFVGTHRDNVNDKVAKNRQLKGMNAPMAKLTDFDVFCIRDARSKNVSRVSLVTAFNITYMSISNIERYKSWTHLQPPC